MRALPYIALLLSLACPPAHAERADREKPTQVESDRMQYDDQRQVNVFTGNVVLTKGTILLRADRLVVRQDAEGFQYGTATGNLAWFRQKRDAPGEQYVEGQARQIDYNGKLETFHLQQQAMLRRTENGRVLDEVHGSEILYEARSEFFTVEGTRGAAATAENPGGRVRVVIQPREGPASGTPSGPASGAPSVAPSGPTSGAPSGPLTGPSAPKGEPVPLKPAENLRTPGEGGSGR